MRIAVVGATGVLGRNVVPRLVERGHTVRVGVRDPSKARGFAALGVEAVSADIFDEQSLEKLLARCDTVLHLATAIPRPDAPAGTRPDWSLNDRIRREGTALLLAAAQRAGVRRIVAQSIAMLHGDPPGAAPSDVLATEATPLPPASPVLQSALDLESLVRAAPMDHAILRGALFYGPGTGREEAWRLAARAGTLRLPGDGGGFLSLVHVVDCATAVVAAAEAKAGRETYLVADDAPVTYRELFGYLAAQERLPEPASGGPILLASFRVSNAKLRAGLKWTPAYPTYRSGLS